MPALIEDNIACLRQGITLLHELSDSDYTAPQEACHGSSIGGHLRHNIDHYLSFIRGLASGAVDYDARVRDAKIERQPQSAEQALSEIIAELNAIKESQLDVELAIVMDSGGASPHPSRSTVRRELQFLLSHTVHHYALISTIRHLQGRAIPPDFGVAPSTLKHQYAN